MTVSIRFLGLLGYFCVPHVQTCHLKVIMNDEKERVANVAYVKALFR
jgi:hypothetical protein